MNIGNARRLAWIDANLPLCKKRRDILQLCLEQGTLNVTGLYVQPMERAGLISLAERDGKLYATITDFGKARLNNG